MPDWQERYPTVNGALAHEYRGLPEDQAEAIVRSVFGEGFSLADAEGFFDDVGRTLSGAAQAAAPVLQRALPGVVSGAMGGAAFGLPGIIGGALLGGVGSALGGGAPGAPAAPHPAAPGVPGAFPGPMPGAMPVGAGPTAAIGQLLAVLGSPTVQQALSSMLLGPAGAHSVPTPAGNQLPVAAITNLLGMLANRASAEWEAVVPSAEAESFGEGVDLASPEARSAWVLGQLAPPEAASEDAEAGGDESADEAWIDELYDELEAELIVASPEATFDEAYYDEAAPESWSLSSHG